MRTHLPRRLAAVAATTSLWLATACAGDDASEQARAVFVAFEQALRAGDEATCRTLLTRESAVALDEIPWSAIASKQPLQVVGARQLASEFRVDVRDPNLGDTPGQYVVVREHGRFVVDLVATAALTAEIHEDPNSEDVFEPVPLTPADHDRIRARELAMPPR
ncbi:MAG: hypothetical protein ACK5AL_16165 [Planctomycetota bacterium]|jgi:hypothetical protein